VFLIICNFDGVRVISITYMHVRSFLLGKSLKHRTTFAR
jgi:hypothetical protein